MVYLSSLACADPLNLESQARELILAGHSSFHIDLMDGHYVPNLCMNLDLVKALKRKFKCQIDVHLMVDDPFTYVDLCSEAGTDSLSFHLDGVHFPYRLLEQIKEKGMRAGIVLNPKDSPTDLGQLISLIDYCLVMSVEPGFAGQRFLKSAYDKISLLNQLRINQKLDFQISVDGGIDITAGKTCKALGADSLVMGVYSFFKEGQSVSKNCMEYVTQIEHPSSPQPKRGI